MTATASRLELQGLDALSTGAPAWLNDLRKAHLTAFEQMPFPTMKQETWRRTDPERFQIPSKQLAPMQTSVSVVGSETPFAGITCVAMSEALSSVEGKLGGIHPQAKSNYFSLLAGAALQPALYLEAKSDTTTGSGMLKVTHNIQGGGVSCPRSYLEVGAGSSVTVCQEYRTQEQELLVAPVIEVHVKAGARLRLMIEGAWGNATAVVPTVHAKVEKDGYFQMVVVGTSAPITKYFVESDLVGDGSKSEVLGTVMGYGRQHYDIDAQQNHRVGNTVSDVLFHIALTDRARSIFGGNILCEPGAQRIDGYQQNRNLLLSDKARADSMPRLEIEANDVRCTHGASFSTYDADQRFYLQSRGLSAEESEQLLVTGFFSEVLGRLEHEVAQQHMEAVMTAKLMEVLRKK